jgi:hypothetical protein
MIKKEEGELVQEYLYIDDFVPQNIDVKKKDDEDDDSDRGVAVIDIF